MSFTVVVPTLGRSPWLMRCLEALRRTGGSELTLILVAQGSIDPTAAAQADEVLRFPRALGFAAAVNRGFAVAAAAGSTADDLWATVNDDVLVAADWFSELRAALRAVPSAGAAQGVNERLGGSPSAEHSSVGSHERLDGCGLRWNRRWQAVQIGHGEEAGAAPSATREVFGVSATAAVYRRAALAAVARSGGEVFDERLWAYYEDVDVAVRLRGEGFTALCVPSARAAHAGSVSGRRLAFGGRPLIHGNRLLVLARLLGGGFWRRLPRFLGRDLVDAGRLLGRGDLGGATGVGVGWLRAALRAPGFVRRGASLLPPDELRGESG